MQESLNDGDVLFERNLMSVSTMMSVCRTVPASGAQGIIFTHVALAHTWRSVVKSVCAVPIAWVIRGREFE